MGILRLTYGQPQKKLSRCGWEKTQVGGYKIRLQIGKELPCSEGQYIKVAVLSRPTVRASIIRVPVTRASSGEELCYSDSKQQPAGGDVF